MSKETLGIVLAVVVGVVGFSLWLADKYGKATPTLTVMVLLVMAGLCLCAVCLIPWLWNAPSTPEKIFRVSSVTLLVIMAVGQFGFWVTRPNAKRPPPSEAKIPAVGPLVPIEEAKQHLAADPDRLTLYDLFLLDFPSEAQYQTGLTILSSNTHLEWAVVWNIAEGSELIKLYIPHSTETAGIIQGFIPNYKDALKEANKLEVKNRDQLSSRTLTFSNRIYAYNYDYLSVKEAAALDRAYKSAGLILVLRDMNYLQMRQLEAKVKLGK